METVPLGQVLGIAVTVILFLIVQTVSIFKWVVANKAFMTSMALRTEIMMKDLERVNDTLKALATADLRIGQIESVAKDHEVRIRDLEEECRDANYGRTH